MATKQKASPLAIFIVFGIMILCGFWCNKSCNEAKQEVIADDNKPINIAKHNIQKYLYENLKDYDSYKEISYTGLIDIGIATDIIGYSELTRAAYPHTGPGYKFPKDSTGSMDKGEKVYILKQQNGWNKIREVAIDSIACVTSKLYYWTAWLPDNVLTSLPLDINTKYEMKHKFKAKNSFGAYDVSEIIFYFDKDLNIIKTENE